MRMASKKLNILHLTTHLNLGGISSYIAVLGDALTKRGHHVAVLSSGGQKTDDLIKKGVRCFEFPIRTKSELSPKLFLALRGVVALLKQEKFDLLHAHTRVTQVLAHWAGRLAGVPTMSTAHGFYKTRWGRQVFPCWGEQVVAVGELVAQELEQTHGVPKEKIAIVHNALDIEDLQARLRRQDPKKIRSEYGIPDDAFVVGCISRLVRDKGQEYLIEAVQTLVPEMPRIFLLVVGEGREKERLQAQIKNLALEEYVRLIPGVNDTAGLLCAMDVYAHPATFREGFGLSMAEAMIAKKPVLATTIPAIHTIFKNGVNALLVPPKDAPALAQAIRRLSADAAFARSIAEAGHGLAASLCRSERQAEEIEQVYYKVIASTEGAKQSNR